MDRILAREKSPESLQCPKIPVQKRIIRRYAVVASNSAVFLNWDFWRLTGWAGFFPVIDSAEFQAFCTEVEEEAHFQARNFDVVDGLGEVYVVQG